MTNQFKKHKPVKADQPQVNVESRIRLDRNVANKDERPTKFAVQLTGGNTVEVPWEHVRTNRLGQPEGLTSGGVSLVQYVANQTSKPTNYAQEHDLDMPKPTNPNQNRRLKFVRAERVQRLQFARESAKALKDNRKIEFVRPSNNSAAVNETNAPVSNAFKKRKPQGLFLGRAA